MIAVPKSELESLLKKAQRKSVDGCLVESCIIEHDGKETLSITSLVKDGVSSVGKFSLKVICEHPQIWPVPSIDNLLKVLKYHGRTVKLTGQREWNSQIKVQSGSKTTTLTASPQALAYPSSPYTLLEWHTKSTKIAEKINLETMSYESAEGPIASAMAFHVDSTDLFEAFRCDGMNGKKTGKYKFIFDTDGFHIETGTELKGLTKTTISEFVTTAAVVNSNGLSDRRTMYFEGGLEDLTKQIVGDVTLGFVQFRTRKGSAGEWGLIVKIDDDFVFQTSVIE
tara:strand:- start:381 stop:1226 length:846 start_codon:yes stop_codon:yes gene_type:complete